MNGRRKWITYVAAPKCTCQETIKRHKDIDTNKYVLDELPSIKGYRLGDIYNVKTRDDLFTSHNAYETTKWFTPKDDDFE